MCSCIVLVLVGVFMYSASACGCATGCQYCAYLQRRAFVSVMARQKNFKFDATDERVSDPNPILLFIAMVIHATMATSSVHRTCST